MDKITVTKQSLIDLVKVMDKQADLLATQDRKIKYLEELVNADVVAAAHFRVVRLQSELIDAQQASLQYMEERVAALNP